MQPGWSACGRCRTTSRGDQPRPRGTSTAAPLRAIDGRHVRAGIGDPPRTSPSPADAADARQPKCVFGSCSCLELLLSQKRDRTTLSQAMGLAGRGYRLPTGAACAPDHEGAAGAEVALTVWGCLLPRRARAAWYSRARARRPRKVPRHCHLRSRSLTWRTASRQAEQQ
jgi:hypothetical protein